MLSFRAAAMPGRPLPFRPCDPGLLSEDARHDAQLGGNERFKSSPLTRPELFPSMSEAGLPSFPVSPLPLLASSFASCACPSPCCCFLRELPSPSPARPERQQRVPLRPLPSPPPQLLAVPHLPLQTLTSWQYPQGSSQQQQQLQRPPVVRSVPASRPRRARSSAGLSVAEQVRRCVEGGSGRIQAYQRHNDLGLCRHLCCCARPDSDPRQPEALDAVAVALLTQERLQCWERSGEAATALAAQSRSPSVVVQQQAAIKKGSRSQHESNARLHPDCNDACRRYRGLLPEVEPARVQALLDALPLPKPDADGAAEVQVSVPASLLPLARRAVSELLQRAQQDEQKRSRQQQQRSRREEDRRGRQRSKKQRLQA